MLFKMSSAETPWMTSTVVANTADVPTVTAKVCKSSARCWKTPRGIRQRTREV